MNIRSISRFFIISLLSLPVSSHYILSEPYWIFFKEEPTRSIDAPLPDKPIREVKLTGARIRTISRYFNAVSVEWNGNIRVLEDLPDVASVRPVRSLGTIYRFQETQNLFKKGALSHRLSHTLNYGISYDQLNALNIPSLHDLGYSGNNVTIGIIDTGFDMEQTGCLEGVHIAHTRNFIKGGGNVSGDDHGTLVLSCLAGALDGEYYGAAYGATFLLAVTDDLLTEFHADEDRWVAGVEWCDSLGADIISSSLVYDIFDAPEKSYTKNEMDGKTSLVARAAEIAFSRGILVVNAAGNEGGNDWHIIATPGDAEHVLAVGAVGYLDEKYAISTFSSRGPTADGRIKPDLVAPGIYVRVPRIGSQDEYTAVNGTSFATPFISGLCALLKEAHPDWTPLYIMQALKNTATDLGDPGPDNDYGWGLPEAVKALNYVTTDIPGSYTITKSKSPLNTVRFEIPPVNFELDSPFPNPCNSMITIPFSVRTETQVTITIYDITGRHIATVWDKIASPGRYQIVWTADDYASGTYLIQASAGNRSQSQKIMLIK